MQTAIEQVYELQKIIQEITLLPKEQADVLAQILATVTNNKNPIAMSNKRDHEIEAIRSIIEPLRGKTLNIGDTTINFGENNQIGEINIRDIASGDISHFTVNIFNTPDEKASHAEIKSLEIVDVSFDDGDTEFLLDYPIYMLNLGGFSALDIKLINFKSEVVVLKEVTLTVHHIWQLDKFPYTGASLPPSAKYSIRIPILTPPFLISKKISQVIAPNTADRFLLVLEPVKEDCIFHLSVNLKYNTNNNIYLEKDVIFATRSSSCTYPSFDVEEMLKFDENFLNSEQEDSRRQWLMIRPRLLTNNAIRHDISKIDALRNAVVRSFESKEPILELD